MKQDPTLCTCRQCGATGDVLDEFTSPYTGLCRKCSANPRVEQNGMVVLDGVALPFYVTERFVTPDFEEAMEYWPNYARHVIHSKGKPRSPQEYLLTLTKIVERAKVYDDNRTSERILQRVTEHFGLAQVTAWFQQVNQFRGIIK